MKENLINEIEKWKKNKSPLKERRLVLISENPTLKNEAIIRLVMSAKITDKSETKDIKAESEFHTQGQSQVDEELERGDINVFNDCVRQVEQDFEKKVQEFLK